MLQEFDGRMRPSLHDQLRAGIALREKLEPRGAQRDRGNRGASEEGLQEPYSAWPFGFARGRTPLLFRILTNASVATRITKYLTAKIESPEVMLGSFVSASSSRLDPC